MSVPDPAHAIFTDGAGEVTALLSDDIALGPSAAALAKRGARILGYPYTEGLRGALSAIAEDGCDDLLIEAGPTLLSALWRVGYVDELIVVTAGGMAGSAAPAAFLGTADAEGTDLRPRMRAVEAAVIGDDAVSVWRPIDDDPEGSGEGSV
jgi:diaminohydroxyphosphoribosylaminopyrimidine deaminase/5-amino-6-(5-phosphoribosylamino)uracil reductase